LALSTGQLVYEALLQVRDIRSLQRGVNGLDVGTAEHVESADVRIAPHADNIPNRERKIDSRVLRDKGDLSRYFLPGHTG